MGIRHSAVATTITKTEIDLVNDLLMETSWDAEELQLPHSNLLPQKEHLPEPMSLVLEDDLAV